MARFSIGDGDAVGVEFGRTFDEAYCVRLICEGDEAVALTLDSSVCVLCHYKGVLNRCEGGHKGRKLGGRSCGWQITEYKGGGSPVF